MKIFTTCALLLLACLQSASADWVIVQKTLTDGQASEATIQIKGAKARTDISKDASVVVDSDSGEATVLMHSQKSLMKMNADSMKNMMAMAGNLLGGNKPPAKPVATGQKEKVGQWDTEIYTWTGSIGTGKFWVAQGVNGAEALNVIQDKINKAMGNPAAAFAPASTDFPGMVVKSELQVMGKTVTSETVSIDDKATLADSLFVLPTDYKEIQMPSLPTK